MAISNFIPEIWTQEALQILMNNLVAEKVCNRTFEREIQGIGDKLHIVACGNLADAEYAADNITYSALSDSDNELSIDLKRYVAFEVPDLDKVQSKPEFVNKFTAQAAYQIADYFDTQVLAEYANAGLDSYETGSTAWQFSADCSDFPRLPAAILRQLEGAKAPMGRPFLIGPPELREAANRYLGGRATQMGDDVTRNGFVGQVMGVNIYTSNNCTSGHGLAGIEGETVALAYQLNKVEAIRLEGRFSDGVRMLVVGGIKTFRPAISIDVNLNTTLIGS